ncbi:hypothetical protein FHR81_001756 [Actinoalloteichus hoggarensis]|uniref:Uncharacterized protein n=1 Tax=Actinoalloteichus hoggarensis TaxID=1470176 RepID=A0A221W4L4_9PSEU|nr:hypothetical protein [Actinoalloteichus hoggarensis]ASO20788.1 hypothetical protein AHOG_15810 [Actinoalloteichus hoggarensis]MBB5920718.1 hypothetical protein [Actinoalloteichus hoggarensis]
MSAKLADVVHEVRRLPRPTTASTEDVSTTAVPEPEWTPVPPEPVDSSSGRPTRLGERVLTALITGFGVAVGQRLLDALWPRRGR